MIRELLKFLAAIYKRLRLFWWNLTMHSSKVLNLYVLQSVHIRFKGKGDIVKILYSDQHLIRFKKSFEYQTLELFVSFLKEGDVVIDVGANVGLFSLLGSKYIGNTGKIYSFEPTLDTYEIFNENIKLNTIENIFPLRIPLADKSIPIIMVNPDKKGGEYLDALNRIQRVEKDEQVESIMYTETFDDFVRKSEIHRIDIVKIDIEGAELLFFKGAKDSLSKFRPKIIFEANENHCQAFDYKVIDVLLYVKELGYDLKQINEEQWLAT